jgi:hypothetical protein
MLKHKNDVITPRIQVTNFPAVSQMKITELAHATFEYYLALKSSTESGKSHFPLL